jgi:predicted small metal-binding protein
MELLKEVYCDDQEYCQFMVRGHDGAELIEVLKNHAKRAHSLDATEDEIKAKIKVVEK